MAIELILYKGISYSVTSPGELIYDGEDKKHILDQLNNLSKVGNKRIKYLKDKYNLSELDYYIIVVLKGDESKLPKCSYVNPKTKENCNEFKKFRSLIPTRGEIFHDGCENHIANAAAQIKQREAYKKGITGLQKADRKSKVWRDRLREHALKQMRDGDSIFSPDNVRRKDIQKPISSIKISGYNDIFNELGIDRDNTSIEELILVDKRMFLNKGESNDICYYYIVDFEDSNIFKLGVTSNIDSRVKRGYHGLKYKNLSILFESTREIIADLEYNIKMAFRDSICFGNEGFSINKKSEILNYIKNIINSINNSPKN
jgi:hypothetical protein